MVTKWSRQPWHSHFNRELKQRRRRRQRERQKSNRAFHSRGQHLWKFIGTKESVCIRKEFNPQRIGLGHQHGRRLTLIWPPWRHVKTHYRFRLAKQQLFVQFLAVAARPQRESASFHVSSRTGTQINNLLFFSWTLIQSFRIQLQQKITNIWWLNGMEETR